MRAAGVPWTEVEIETLKRDWLNGKSAGLIARCLRRSRSAICGKVHRLGLPLGTTQRVCAIPTTPRAKPMPKPVVVKKTPAPLPPMKCLPLIEIDRNMCHALVDANGPLYCGRRVVRLESGKRSSYCVEHHHQYHKPMVMR
jgi:hypothetical protein